MVDDKDGSAMKQAVTPVEAHESRSFYDRDASSYEADRFDDERDAKFSARSVAVISAAVDAQAPAAVLEIGCGTGRITRSLVRPHRTLVVADISAEMLSIARQSGGQQLPASQSGAQALPFRSASLDAVVAINIFTHIASLQQPFQEVARVLRPGGTFHFSYSNRNSIFLPAALVVNRRGRAYGYDVPSRWHTPSEVVDALRNAGLAPIAVHGAVYVPRGTRKIPGARAVLTQIAAACDTHPRLARAIAPWRFVSAALTGTTR